jgi:hypothetical protein
MQSLSQAVLGIDSDLLFGGFHPAAETGQAKGIILDDIGLRGLEKTELRDPAIECPGGE